MKQKQKDPNKVIAGIIGGQVTSEKKAAAARLNAKKGGRPKTRAPFANMGN